MSEKQCDFRDGRITEGMEVAWNKGEFHPGYIAEAVLSHRTRQADELEDAETRETLEEIKEEEESKETGLSYKK